MGQVSRRDKWLWAAAVVLSMLAAGPAVYALYPDDWRTAEAVVESSEISESRGRNNVSWVLRINATYEISGRIHTAENLEVARRSELADAEAAADEWPAGRRFTLYFNAENPESTSMHADGQRLRMIALATYLTPLAVFIIGAIVIVWRQARARRLEMR